LPKGPGKTDQKDDIENCGMEIEISIVESSKLGQLCCVASPVLRIKNL
jgi:hypothetical protein